MDGARLLHVFACAHKELHPLFAWVPHVLYIQIPPTPLTLQLVVVWRRRCVFVARRWGRQGGTWRWPRCAATGKHCAGRRLPGSSRPPPLRRPRWPQTPPRVPLRRRLMATATSCICGPWRRQAAPPWPRPGQPHPPGAPTPPAAAKAAAATAPRGGRRRRSKCRCSATTWSSSSSRKPKRSPPSPPPRRRRQQLRYRRWQRAAARRRAARRTSRPCFKKSSRCGGHHKHGTCLRKHLLLFAWTRPFAFPVLVLWLCRWGEEISICNCLVSNVFLKPPNIIFRRKHCTPWRCFTSGR